MMKVVRDLALDLHTLGQVLCRLVNPVSGPDPVGQAEDPVHTLGHELESFIADVGDDAVGRISRLV